MVATAPARSAATARNRIRLTGQLARLTRLANGLLERFDGAVQLPSTPSRQLGLPLVEQSVGEGVFTGQMGGLGLVVLAVILLLALSTAGYFGFKLLTHLLGERAS